jgi:hypothetical protein
MNLTWKKERFSSDEGGIVSEKTADNAIILLFEKGKPV